MKYQFIILLSLLITLSACNSNSNSNNSSNSTVNQAAIAQQVKELTTNKAKKDYLTQILSVDQQFRKGQEDKLLAEGKESQAYKDFIANRSKLDRENFQKIEQYLAAHGHPVPFEVSLNLTSTPITVVSHAGNLEEQKKYYSMFQQAYKKGYFTDHIFMKYMHGMYHQKFGKKLKLKSPYTGDDEINALESALGLTPTK